MKLYCNDPYLSDEIETKNVSVTPYGLELRFPQNNDPHMSGTVFLPWHGVQYLALDEGEELDTTSDLWKAIFDLQKAIIELRREGDTDAVV